MRLEINLNTYVRLAQFTKSSLCASKTPWVPHDAGNNLSLKLGKVAEGRAAAAAAEAEAEAALGAAVVAAVSAGAG